MSDEKRAPDDPANFGSAQKKWAQWGFGTVTTTAHPTTETPTGTAADVIAEILARHAGLGVTMSTARLHLPAGLMAEYSELTEVFEWAGLQITLNPVLPAWAGVLVGANGNVLRIFDFRPGTERASESGQFPATGETTGKSP